VDLQERRCNPKVIEEISISLVFRFTFRCWPTDLYISAMRTGKFKLIAGEMLTLYAQLPDEAQKKRLSSLPVDPFAMDFIV
jgi:hypothetical protein